MKKFLYLLVIFAITAVPAFSETLKYLTIPVFDNKTELEIARVIVPEEFNVESKTEWTRNFENPVTLVIKASSKEKNIIFSYNSPKSYIDNFGVQEQKNNDFDTDFKTLCKSAITPIEYLKERIQEENPQAREIKFVSEANLPEGLQEYLIGLMYQRIEELVLIAKTDLKYSNIKILNPEIIPYIATFSYEINEKTYQETFLTMLSSVEYKFTEKNKKTKSKKLWKINELYSYQTEQDSYDKYFRDFVIFVANSMPNNKAVNALEHVKQEMDIELSPYFVDYNKLSSRKNKPSDLFKRYFEIGLPDYSYTSSMIKPTLSQVRWLVNILEPQTEFYYRNIKQVWQQKYYVPQKYEYVYLNKINGTLLISTEPQKQNKEWITLKKSILK